MKMLKMKMTLFHNGFLESILLLLSDRGEISQRQMSAESIAAMEKRKSERICHSLHKLFFFFFLKKGVIWV